MALTPPALVAAVVLAIGEVTAPPLPRLVPNVVERAVNDMAKTLATRRHVRLTRPLGVRLVDRSEMKAARDALVEASPGAGFDSGAPTEKGAAASPRRRPSPPPVTRADQDDRKRAALQLTLLRHLGLLGRGPPLARVSPGAPPEQEITGLYDVTHQRLLVANWADLSGGRFALARDVAQAVLDRRFDLSRFLAVPATFSFDGMLARQAVVNGDATAQALEDLDPAGGLPSPRALGVIQEQVRTQIAAENPDASSLDLRRRLFVELDGLMFVAWFRSRLPWLSVDEIWRRAPESSEQILHPDKYERAEGPDDVGGRLPRQLGRTSDSWSVVYGDTLGEFGTRLFLEHVADPYRAERAAAGWGGDRALLLRKNNSRDGDAGLSNTFVAWLTTWDDETDATDFATEATSALASLAGVPVPGDRLAAGRPRMKDAEGRLFALERRGRAVGMLMAAPATGGAALERLMSAAAGVPRRAHQGPRNQGRGGMSR